MTPTATARTAPTTISLVLHERRLPRDALLLLAALFIAAPLLLQCCRRQMPAWISESVSSLGWPLVKVSTMIVGPKDLAAVNAALAARNTVSSSTRASVLSVPTLTSAPASEAALMAARMGRSMSACRTGYTAVSYTHLRAHE